MINENTIGQREPVRINFGPRPTFQLTIEITPLEDRDVLDTHAALMKFMPANYLLAAVANLAAEFKKDNDQFTARMVTSWKEQPKS